MTNDRQIERLLDSWFTDGPTVAPDRAIDGVAARITRQAQRPAWRLQPWRFPTVNTPLKLVLIGAALVMAVAAGSILIAGGRGQGAVVAPTPTPTPTLAPTPTPTPSPAPLAHGKLEPGTYVGTPVDGKPMTWTVTVPAGWVGYEDWAVLSDVPEDVPGVIVAGPGENDGIPEDSCKAAGTAPAKSVAELIAGIQAHDDWIFSEPVDTTLGGYPGTRIDLEVPADITCESSPDYMVLVSSPDGSGFYAQGPSNRFRLWFLDVEGSIVTVMRNSFPDTAAELLAQADDILDSIVITP